MIRLLRLAARGALTGHGNDFLIGLQHLDFNDQAATEEIRKINPAYGNAIARDVADRGNALAEKIDAADGNTTATAAAKTLLMSSLSTAETRLRGLTDGELIETLVDPLLQVSEIKTALSRLQGQAWYLFQGIDQRVFFGQTANVTAEITEIAAAIADEQVDQTLREKLREVFRPRTNALYSDKMAILPALDEIQLDDERPTLVVLECPADRIPAEFNAWWNRQDLQNRVLLLTADPNAVTTLRAGARRMRAIEKVGERLRVQHGRDSPQMAELDGVQSREAANFTSALRETFKTIVFPIKGQLRRVDDFRMEFDRNDYSGEQQIVDTLAKRGKFIPAERFDAEFDNMYLEAEDLLFDADAVQPSSLRRNAAVRPAWFWLPRGGLDELVRKATNRGFWRNDRDGLVERKWQRVTRVTVRQDDFAPDPIVDGQFQLQITPEDADTIYVSEGGPPDPARAAKLDGRVYKTAAPAVWLLAVDSTGKAATGPVCEWRASLRVKPDVRRVSNGYRVALLALPRAASIRATFDGADPRTGPVVPHPEIDAPADAVRLRVIAELNGQFSQEETALLTAGMSESAQPLAPRAALRPDAPATMTSRLEPADTAAASAALDRLARLPGTFVRGGSVHLEGGRSEADYLTLRFGADIRIPAEKLAEQVEALRGLLDAPAPTFKLRLDAILFPSGRDFLAFCDAANLDFDRVKWEQEP